MLGFVKCPHAPDHSDAHSDTDGHIVISVVSVMIVFGAVRSVLTGTLTPHIALPPPLTTAIAL
jgi:hypothetical protein